MKIIEVKDFSFRYANGSRESLSHVSLDVEEKVRLMCCAVRVAVARVRCFAS